MRPTILTLIDILLMNSDYDEIELAIIDKKGNTLYSGKFAHEHYFKILELHLEQYTNFVWTANMQVGETPKAVVVKIR